MMKNAPSLLAFVLVLLAGCSQPRVSEGPDYARPLAPGEQGLRRVTDPARLPDLAAAFDARDVRLDEAFDESIRWFETPSSRRHFPQDGIRHAHARASLHALRDLFASARTGPSFADELLARFDVYESVGYDGDGTVLFTGYYAPIFTASKTRSARFAHPLYRRPADLVTDPETGQPRGRLMSNGGVEPYPVRAEIERTNMLAGQELVWLEDALSAYLIHVNGSAKLRLPGGDTMYVGYAGKTDRPYGSLSRAMIEEGLLDETELNLPAIKRVYQRTPRAVENLMAANESYVFFTEVSPDVWPAGSLGVRVTPFRSLATDKKVFPRAGLVLVDTDRFTLTGQREPLNSFMLDQDTGGAIQAPGRADIFMGIGPTAEIRAGHQFAEGRLFYFFLKPDVFARTEAY